MLSLGTLVPEAPWCVFYATSCQVYRGLTHTAYSGDTLLVTGTVTWYQTHTQTHTDPGAGRLTHLYNYILTPLVMCSQQLLLLHWMIKWIIHWYQKFTFHNVFSFQKLFACKKWYIYWLDAIRLVSSCETQILLIEMG